MNINKELQEAKRANFYELYNNYQNYLSKKELFYVKAIKNLVIKNNFLKLSLYHAEKQISNKKFFNEIKNNSEKYAVTINNLNDINDILIIDDLIRNMGLDFTIDEVSELFSLDLNNLEDKLSNLK